MIPALRPLLAGLACTLALPALAAFTDNGDGTVTDTLTGLMWDKCAWGQTNLATCAGGAASTHAWSAALGVAVTANTASHRGYRDWRLPNRNELESLVDRASSSPAIAAASFPNTVTGFHWSSTTYASGAMFAWGVNFDSGQSNTGFKPGPAAVRLVRGGAAFSAFDAMVDTTPDAFVIAALANQPPAATVTTGAVTVAGLAPAAAVGAATSIGTIVKNGVDTGLATTLVVNGDTVAVRLAASGTPGATLTGTLEIGLGSSAFTVTSLAAAGAASAAPIPSLSEWGTIFLSLLLATLGAGRAKSRR